VAATPYSSLIARLRVDGNDTATSNPRLGETPGFGLRNGSNQVFRLAYPNIVAGTIYCTYGSTVRSTTNFTVLDAATAYIQMTAAPDAGTTQPFYFDYYQQWFLDADYTSMIDEATEELGTPSGTAVVENLYPALVNLALERYWKRRASQYANIYASSGGGSMARPETVTGAFLKLAQDARKTADAMRKNAYSDPGGKLKPASGTITYGISAYTPRR
jgi:hypothetical protein